jgi:hypothetical protein
LIEICNFANEKQEPPQKKSSYMYNCDKYS